MLPCFVVYRTPTFREKDYISHTSVVAIRHKKDYEYNIHLVEETQAFVVHDACSATCDQVTHILESKPIKYYSSTYQDVSLSEQGIDVNGEKIAKHLHQAPMSQICEVSRSYVSNYSNTWIVTSNYFYQCHCVITFILFFCYFQAIVSLLRAHNNIIII